MLLRQDLCCPRRGKYFSARIGVVDKMESNFRKRKNDERIEENIGGANIHFSPEELAAIRQHLDSIEILGGRYPEEQEKMTGL